MKKKFFTLMLTAVLATSCIACTNKTTSDKSDNNKSTTSSATASESISVSTDEKVKSQDIKVDDLKDLTDKGVITGVKDITVEEGTDVDLNELVYADKDIVKSVDIDDSKVNYDKAGTYNVIYTITFNGDKLRDYIDKNKLDVGFDTDGNTVVVKTTVTVTVATKEDAEKAIEEGKTNVVTEKTKESVKNDNKAKANNNAVESTPTPAQSSSSEKSDNSSSSNNNSSNSNNNSNVGSSDSNKNTSNSGSSNSSNSTSSSGASSNSNSSNSSNSGSSSSTSGSSNSSNSNTSNNSNSSASSEKPQSHNHNYVEVSRTEATCTTDGVITKQCSCGATITESNGSALGHDMVHHYATTHTEQRLVKDAWTETIYGYRYVCNGCGTQFETDVEAGDHIAASGIHGTCHNYSLEKVPVDTVQHDAQYETVEVSDNNAYDECSRCGYKQ